MKNTTLGTQKQWSLLTGGRYSEVVYVPNGGRYLEVVGNSGLTVLCFKKAKVKIEKRNQNEAQHKL